MNGASAASAVADSVLGDGALKIAHCAKKGIFHLPFSQGNGRGDEAADLADKSSSAGIRLGGVGMQSGDGSPGFVVRFGQGLPAGLWLRAPQEQLTLG